MRLQQPALGIVATAAVVLLSLGFISLFAADTFSGWVSYGLMCLVPMEIVVGITWECKRPAFAGARSQPAKGVLLVLCTVAAAIVVAPLLFQIAGGGVRQASPMLMMCTIVSVIVTFWGVIMWGGWPFIKLIKNRVTAGLVMLAACYIVNYALFRVFFDYGFMRGAPVYVAQLDPHGLFNAWNALVVYMAALGVMFLMLHLDLWPLTNWPSVMRQPVLGIVWTVLALGIGAAAFYIGVAVMGMDVVAFMVKVPVPFIFGTIVVLNMLQGSLFAKFRQPVKGILNASAAALIGSALAWIYGLLAPAVSGKLSIGPPGYDFERWLASALLGVTFPLLIFHAEFFQLWPLKRADSEVSARH